MERMAFYIDTKISLSLATKGSIVSFSKIYVSLII